METHWIETVFGPVQIRVYRLREGWWPVALGQPLLPRRPALDGPMPRSVREAVERIASTLDRMAAHAR